MGSYEIKNVRNAGNYFLQGNEALAEGAIATGCRFYAGYPITPATEIMHQMLTLLKEFDGKFIQMEDEIASLGAVIGAAWSGAKAMTATSGPGFSLMMENLGYAASTETPCVIVDVQRAGPSTGQPTKPASGDIMQSRWGSHGDYEIIVLSPWSVQEMYDFAVKAFNMAEQYRVPCIILADEAVAHLRENLTIPEKIEIFERDNRTGKPIFGGKADDEIPPMPSFGQGEAIMVTGSAHDAEGTKKVADPKTQRELVTRLVNKIRKNAENIMMTASYGIEEDGEALIVAYGFTARSALNAVKSLRRSGLKIGLLRVQTIWPFPDQVIKRMAQRCRKVFVPEMNMGQLVWEVERVAGCHSEVIPINQVDGQVILPKTIIREIQRIS